MTTPINPHTALPTLTADQVAAIDHFEKWVKGEQAAHPGIVWSREAMEDLVAFHGSDIIPDLKKGFEDAIRGKPSEEPPW